MGGRKRVPTYQFVGAPLMRASASSGDLCLPVWPGLDGDGGVESWCGWISAVWSAAGVAEAVALASPVLAERVGSVCSGARPDPAQVRRIIVALARYVIRMRGRATPFGLFAGVAPVNFSDHIEVHWSGGHRTRVRPDAARLAAVTAGLESCSRVRPHLSLVVNNLAFVRGERLFVPWRPHDLRQPRGAQRGDREVSVRHTAPVRSVTALARVPITLRALVDALAAGFGEVPRTGIEALVAQLIDCGVLISCLHSRSTVTDKPGYLANRLREIGAHALPGVHPILSALTVASEAGKARESTTATQDGAASMGADVAVDLELGCTLTLPLAVARQAEVAADALARLTPYPSGHPEWSHYLSRFLDRYGVGAVVALPELLDPVHGLGMPRHLGEPGCPDPHVGVSERDCRLLALAQQAALDGAREIDLDDAMIDALTAAPVGTGDSVRYVPHFDLCVDVRARTMGDLERGAFTVAVTGIGRSAIATSGRFLELLAPMDRDRIIERYRSLPPAVEGAMVVQLSFPAHHPRADNLAQVPPVFEEVLSLGEYPGPECTLEVEDLVVTADRHRLYLVSRSRGCVVEPVVVSALARHAMPPLARLLAELPHARTASVSLFDWGVAGCLPFRPRLRYRGVILSDARWLLDPALLPAQDAAVSQWRTALAALRERLRLPSTVYAGTGDRRLRLNLDEPMDLDVLRAHLDRARGPITLVEAPSSADHGWFDGRAHELLIPMVSTAPPAPPPPTIARRAMTVIGPEHAILPGSRVLSARLDCHPEAVESIVTGHLPALLDGWVVPPRWWFLRYSRPAPHLRLRLHLDRDGYGDAAERIGAWAGELRRRGLCGDLVLDTYRPELARYGGHPDAMAAAQALFAADSVAAQAQLGALARSRQLHPEVLTAASMVDLACSMAGSRRDGLAWLVRRSDLARTDGRASTGHRDLPRQALALYATVGDNPLPGGGEDPGHLAAWAARRQMARHYVDVLAHHGHHPAPDSVVVSLLHLHHVRALGIDPASETRCHRLARAVALSLTARPAASTLAASTMSSSTAGDRS